MSTIHTDNYLVGLVRELCHQPEREWVEFKCNKAEPKEIGRYISALANAATLNDQPYGYLLWGVEGNRHEPVGTTFSPQTAKQGNGPLESWLVKLLEPKINFRFYSFYYEDKQMVLMKIPCAISHPVRFSGMGYIRIGNVTKPLGGIPEKERELWRAFDRIRFEAMAAIENLGVDEVFRLLAYPAYFDLLDQPLPKNQKGIIEALANDNLIRRNDAGGWDVLNIGAILLAKDLDNFPRLGRKAVRVIIYSGTDRTVGATERTFDTGYAVGLDSLTHYIDGLLPSHEVIEQARRQTVHAFPPLAVRELVANALIHQDFSITGAGPMVEIFEGRVEIANPGKPLVDPRRFVDIPPQSRNEALAALMRRFGFSEERGSGIDKALIEIEKLQSPAPLFEVPSNSTRATLYAPKHFRDMSKVDRIHAVYMHACLRYVQGAKVTNATLRERFGVPRKAMPAVSRLLNESVEAGAIVIANPSDGTKSRSYLPFWAAPENGSREMV